MEPPLNNLSALVVDDEPAIARMAAIVLRHAGCEVTVAFGGREALEAISSSTPGFDLVVTDYVMPEIGGEAVVNACRQTSPPIPVLVISGYIGPGLVDAPVLQKPFSPSELVEQAGQVLHPPRKNPNVESGGDGAKEDAG